MRRLELSSRVVLALCLCVSGCSDDDRLADGSSEGGRPNVDDESTDTGEETETGLDPVELQLEAVSYHLDWETLELGAAVDAAWEVQSDLGYRVRLHEGWATIYGMSLIPCTVAGAEVDDSGFLATLLAPFSSRTAHAGHSGENDPSADYERRVEDLGHPEAIDYGEVDFDSTAYCQFHFVYGPPNADTAGLPTDADVVGKSVHLTGSWQAPGESTWNEFSVSASHANGKIIDFSEAQLGEVEGRVAFRLVRDWRRTFDQIEFSEVSQWDLELAVLDNLVASARLEIGAL